jgi:hypothetical protein
MSSQPRLDLVHKAVCAGVLGNIEWSDSALRRFSDDPQLDGFKASGVRKVLRDFVNAGGALTAREEVREEYKDPDHPFWYRAIIPVAEFPKGLFVELKLIDHEEEEEPFVQIVNLHRQH